MHKLYDLNLLWETDIRLSLDYIFEITEHIMMKFCVGSALIFFYL
jgi:hypothetical protein